MKKIVLLALLLLLLTGCEKARTVPTPSPPPIPTQVATAPPTPSPEVEGLVWGVNYGLEDVVLAELPTKLATPDALASQDATFVLLGELPAQDIRIYGFYPPGGRGVLIRRGNALHYFDQIYLGVQRFLPILNWDDFNADGVEELAVSYHLGSDVSEAVFELHIYTQQEKQWTDCPFAKEVYLPALEAAVDYRYNASAREVTLTAGRTVAEYTLPEHSRPPEGVVYGDQVFFRFENGAITAVFTASLVLPEGANAPTMATITAMVVFDGTTLGLKDFRVQTVGGV